jgi:peptidoglycan hydrolase-like protein with peptidoglycan-binding domain
MKLSHLLIAGATAVSFSTIAAAQAQTPAAPGTGPGVGATQPAAGATAPGAPMAHDEQTIRQVQERLKEKGHDVSVDGEMGSQTQEALREFQKKEGIAETGQLDEQTLTALGVDTPAAGVTAPPAAPGPTAPTDPAKPADPAAKPGEPAAPGATAAPGAEKKY